MSSSYLYIGLVDEAATTANEHLGLRGIYGWLVCDTRPSLPNHTDAFAPEG